jgi:DNA-directed RNA polymerase specialized sigma24 family protein
MRDSADQDGLYAAEHGAALTRLARVSEANAERRLDLLQDMHVALWRSFASYDARCSVRTWVYRVAPNVTATYVDRERRVHRGAVAFDDVGDLPDVRNVGAEFEPAMHWSG